jgi:hypothetical protein
MTPQEFIRKWKPVALGQFARYAALENPGPFSRSREKVAAKPPDEGNSAFVLTPTLSRERERGRNSASALTPTLSRERERGRDSGSGA